MLNFLDYEKVLALSTIYNFTSIADEVEAIRQLTRKADEIRSKEQLLYFLSEIEESLQIIERELIEYDQFVNMIELSN